MARLVVPKELCVPGGLPLACVVTGKTEGVAFRRFKPESRMPRWVLIGFPALVAIGFPALALTFWASSRSAAWGAWFLPTVLALLVVTVSFLAGYLVHLARRPRSSRVELPFTPSAFRRRWVVQACLISTAAVFFVYLLLALAGRGPLGTFLDTPIAFALFGPWLVVWDVLLTRVSVRFVDSTGELLVLNLPSERAAEAIRAHLAGGGRALHPAPAGARCASHDSSASFSCARCGDFACDGCAPPLAVTATLCRACRAHVSP